MAALDLVIKGGTVATAADTFGADVGVKDGRIVALADELTGAEEVIDAKGKLVLPGGIDSHCHIAQMSSTGLDTAVGIWSGIHSKRRRTKNDGYHPFSPSNCIISPFLNSRD